MIRAALVATLVAACGSRTELDVDHEDSSVDACGATSTITLQIPSDAPWSDTGIGVSAGTVLVIHASGVVRYGPNAPQTTDANGGNFDGQQFFSTAVVPKATICSLIGRVGDAPVPAGKAGEGDGFVGVDYEETMSVTGELFLGFNDQVGEFGDNSGSFTVIITTKNSC
jgi:hypothetical protein